MIVPSSSCPVIGRSEQVSLLQDVLGRDASWCSVPLVFMCGSASSGKRHVVRYVLSQQHHQQQQQQSMWRHAYVHMNECGTPRALFESILSQLSGIKLCAANGYAGDGGPCYTAANFIRKLSDILYNDRGGNVVEEGKKDTNIEQPELKRCRRSLCVDGDGDGGTATLNTRRTAVIVVDGAEKLRNISGGNNLLHVMTRLPELTSLSLRRPEHHGSNTVQSICVILLSEVVWDKFHGGTLVFMPFIITFPAYSSVELVDIVVALDCPSDEEPSFFRLFARHVVDVMRTSLRNLGEVRHVVRLLFPRFVAPALEGAVPRSRPAELLRLAGPYFGRVLENLYLRELSTAEWDERASAETGQGAASALLCSDISATAVSRRPIAELPYYAKFLLMAGYLASYNHYKHDLRFFSKGGSASGHKDRRSRTTSKKVVVDQKYLGPLAFALDRMLAIFYSILDSDCAPAAADVYMQVATLVTLRLLIRVDHGDALEAPKFRCNISFNDAEVIARSLQFDIERFIHTADN